MIKVYPSRLEGEPLETHHTVGPMTVRAWLQANAPKLDLTDPPLSFVLNGVPATLDSEFLPADTLDIHVEPRGYELLIQAVIALVVAVAVALLMPTPSSRQSRQGQGLRASSVEANTARFGEPIPEVAGSPPRVYPDYLLPTRTFYDPGNPQVQWIEMLLCIGKGVYTKSVGDVYIGDTRAVALGDDVEVTFYEPGASLTSEPAAQFWHAPAEVGFTSRGGAGMEVGVISTLARAPWALSYEVIGDAVAIPSEDPATFPDDWTPGLELRLEVPFPATVVPGSPRDQIVTQFGLAHFTPAVGQAIEITGPDAGIYKVAAFTPASGGTPADPGTPSTYTADGPPARLDFGATPAALTVGIGSAAYEVLLTADYGDAAALVAAISSQLNATLVSADLVAGEVRIIERSPYAGSSIVVGGSGAADVFGASPDSIIGDAATPATPASWAALTLNDELDNPVQGLTAGEHLIAIGNEGLRFEIQTIAPKLITVDMVGVPSFVGFPAQSGPNIELALDTGSAAGGWTGPFSVVPVGEVCDAFEVDIVFPNGLMYTKSSGSQRATSVTYIVEWREVGSIGAWESLTRTITHGTPDALGYTTRVDLPEPQAIEVRMRRTTAPSTGKTQNMFQWTGLRGRMVAPAAYEGVTTMAVKLRTGDRISAQADNRIWCKVTRHLPLVEGGTGPTKDLAPFLLHILDSVGYGRDRVDMVALQELHDIWSAREDQFNYAVRDSTTIKTLANHVLKAGFAELVLDRGLLKPVRDARREIPQYIYSPQEFTDYPTITTRLPEVDEVDGVDAEYLDAETGRTETIKYRLFSDQGRRAEKISLIGVTNWTRAWRMAARHRRTLAYRRTAFHGETEMHALNSSYMSYDRIQDGIPGYGQSAFVVAVDGLTLTLSEPMDWGADDSRPGAGRVVSFRQMDGKLTPAQWVTQGPWPEVVELAEAPPIPLHLGGDARDPTMVYFGTVRQWAHDVLVTRIEPRSNGRVTIDAVEYDDRVYADDDRDPMNEVLLTSEVYAPEDVTSTLYPVEFEDAADSAASVSEVKKNLQPTAVDLADAGATIDQILKTRVARYSTYAIPPELVDSSAQVVAIIKNRGPEPPVVIQYSAPIERVNGSAYVSEIIKERVAGYIRYGFAEPVNSSASVAAIVKERV